MKTILIAGFQHETNTFGATKARFKDFEEADCWPPLLRGRDVLSGTAGINLPIAGFIDEAGGFKNFELNPVVWASAEPSSYVTDDAFDRISGMILEHIKEMSRLDGIYLDLHGAMVTESYEDGEGELLRRIRTLTGDLVPIVVSLDLHANVTEQMVALSSCLCIYRTYPHIDMAKTGARAASMLKRLIDGEVFCKAFRQVPFLIALPAQYTNDSPCRELYAQLPVPGARDGVQCDIAMGFPPADIHDAGPAVVAYAQSQQAADLAADQLIGFFNDHEEMFVTQVFPAEEALARAMADGRAPVVIADIQDNPGAGAPSDTTGLLKTLISKKVKNAVLALLDDPETAALAHQVGVGKTFTAALGEKSGSTGSDPYSGSFKVLALSDGRFKFTGAMYAGAYAQIGPTALLQVIDQGADIQVVVGSKRCQCADQAIFCHLGIDLTKTDLIVVKSTVHFRDDFESIAKLILLAESPGVNFCRTEDIPYRNIRPNVRRGVKQ